MAGSRLEKFGTVFTRVRDLMRSKVVKPEDKPIWYDVYEAFPPKRDPLYVKPHTRHYNTKEDPVPQIWYSQDKVRAKFYELYGIGPRPLDLSKSNFVSTCQRFVDKYTELQSSIELDEAALLEETGKVLLTEGVLLRKRGVSSVLAESRDPVLELKLKDVLGEQQSASTDVKETAENTTQDLDLSSTRTL
ncbi:small ribosomal subunit protein mS23 [Gouania willdenowi]|uniref:Small ribosomal subunit protein mS23 n=1 Tax=Gouania willdenowi TaxID=441366 RepID=A0A8C5DZY6_GOUWI|nr:28S ribosomal protein S23, mitochondrial [Gouania willdenowi]